MITELTLNTCYYIVISMTVAFLHVGANGSNEYRRYKRLYKAEPQSIHLNENFPDIASREEFHTSYLPKDMVEILNIRKIGEEVLGISEGGRSAVLKDKTYEIGGQEFALDVKGTGYTTNLSKEPYGFNFIITSKSNSVHFRPRTNEKINGFMGKRVSREVTVITNETDNFHRPLGGQVLEWALDNLRLSDGTFSKTLGMYICPVISVVRIPSKRVLKLSDGRIYNKDYSQEMRLVPSNVRFGDDYYGGIYSLTDINRLRYLTRKSGVSKEDFLRNLLHTGLQASLLPARSIKRNENGEFSAYNYNGVDVDKDGVIAADGKLYFADLEGVDIEKVTLCNVEYSVECNVGRLLSNLENLDSRHDSKSLIREHKDMVEDAMPDSVEYKMGETGLEINLRRSLTV